VPPSVDRIFTIVEGKGIQNSQDRPGK